MKKQGGSSVDGVRPQDVSHSDAVSRLAREISEFGATEGRSVAIFSSMIADWREYTGVK
jgi:hypothetical protein